jgi:predicted transcriptional regulator
MNAPASITAPLDPVTLAMVEELAQARGITGEEFAAAAIRKATEHDTQWRAFVQEGIDSADRGELISQKDMEAWFEERIVARRQA